MTPPFRQSSRFAATDTVRHGFFGREGGVSTGDFAGLNVSQAVGDDEAVVETNRALLADALGGGPLVTLRQVHSNRVVTVEAGPLPERVVEADAMVTRRADLLLGILTADCAPLLLLDSHAGVIGAAHAGWKGAVHGILANTVEAMEALGAQRRRLLVALGPTISGANYETGPDFMRDAISVDPRAEAFFFRPAGGREHFDLPGYLMADAADLGLEAENLGLCTYGAPEQYFSHRFATHHGTRTGRQIAAIGLA